jgi:hypothetical protein
MILFLWVTRPQIRSIWNAERRDCQRQFLVVVFVMLRHNYLNYERSLIHPDRAVTALPGRRVPQKLDSCLQYTNVRAAALCDSTLQITVLRGALLADVKVKH